MRRLIFARCIAVFAVAFALALDSRRRAVNNLARIAADPNGFLAYERRIQHPGLAHNITIQIIGIGLIVLVVEAISRLILRVFAARNHRLVPLIPRRSR